MARPKKDGLDYFPFDIDFFEDEKIEAISGEYGIKGEIVAIRLLCAVYRNGYFYEWTEMAQMKLLKAVPGISAELLDQIVHRLVRWGFFDKTLFDSVRILTSVGIQRRYFSAIKRRKSDASELPYLLGDFGLMQQDVNNNGVNVDINPVNADINACNNPQSKVKESKVNNNIVVADKAPVRAKVENAECFERFFSGSTDLSPLLMQLHSENPDTSTVENLKHLAKLVICEWESTAQTHESHTDWSKHLINQIRIKNRKLNTRNYAANTDRTANADAARAQRDESFMRYFGAKLADGNLPPEVPRRDEFP